MVFTHPPTCPYRMVYVRVGKLVGQEVAKIAMVKVVVINWILSATTMWIMFFDN